MDIVKQLRHVTGRPKECTPKITSAAADEIERLREALRRCALSATYKSLSKTGLENALAQVRETAHAGLEPK